MKNHGINQKNKVSIDTLYKLSNGIKTKSYKIRV